MTHFSNEELTVQFKDKKLSDIRRLETKLFDKIEEYHSMSYGRTKYLLELEINSLQTAYSTAII